MLRLPLRGERPLLSDGGRMLRLPVRQGILNDGSLCVLLDEGALATIDHGTLQVRWTGKLPVVGQRVRIGEAVLALPRAPRFFERVMPSQQATVFDIDDVVDIVNGTHATIKSLRPAGWIVRVPVWLEYRTYRTYAAVLDTPPTPVDGRRIDSSMGENLRYVSSTALLPTGYQTSLSWTRSLPGIKQGEVFAFHREALPPLRAMLKASVAAGVVGYDFENSYRSADWQKTLFDRRLSWSQADKTIADPLAATLRRVARPNGSEHQTGMAFDMASRSGSNEAFAKTDEYAWLVRYGWKYGYVVRYPAGSEAVTGIMFEPWHIRWFGVPVAAWLHHEDAVYEELVAETKVYGAVWLEKAMTSRGTGSPANPAASPAPAPATSSSAIAATRVAAPAPATTLSAVGTAPVTSSAAAPLSVSPANAPSTTSSAVGTSGAAAPNVPSTAPSTTPSTTPSTAPSTTQSAVAGAHAPDQTGASTDGKDGEKNNGDDDGIYWLAVAAAPNAVYASAISSLAPEISEFLSDRRIWLIPMGKGGTISP